MRDCFTGSTKERSQVVKSGDTVLYCGREWLVTRSDGVDLTIEQERRYSDGDSFAVSYVTVDQVKVA